MIFCISRDFSCRISPGQSKRIDRIFWRTKIFWRAEEISKISGGIVAILILDPHAVATAAVASGGHGLDFGSLMLVEHFKREKRQERKLYDKSARRIFFQSCASKIASNALCLGESPPDHFLLSNFRTSTWG